MLQRREGTMIKRALSVLFVVGTILLVASTAPRAVAEAAQPPAAAATKQRTFDFTYAATVRGLQPGQVARVWVPVPQSGDDQQLRVLQRDVPTAARETVEAKYGNHLL